MLAHKERIYLERFLEFTQSKKDARITPWYSLGEIDSSWFLGLKTPFPVMNNKHLLCCLKQSITVDEKISSASKRVVP